MKHAYLIIAHNNFKILEKILEVLDHENNHFYIHIDKKIDNTIFENIKIILEKKIRKSKLYFCNRKNIGWGHFSQIEVELLLLKEANKNEKYSYYHLISGVDFPIKKLDEIFKFFKENQGKEFVHIVPFSNKNEIYKRVSLYHFFPFWSRSKYKYLFWIIETINIKIQLIFNVNRIMKEEERIYYGSNWFSITNDLVEYILKKEEYIRKVFIYTLCGDEIFLQTLVMNSEFKDKIYFQKWEDKKISNLQRYIKANKRYIDWERGNPYIFRTEDVDKLFQSEALFARKFDEEIDIGIIELLVSKIKEDGNDEKRNIF